MRAYLPAGSEVVLLRSNGVHEWYTTKATVDVSNYTVAPCPLRNALPVLTAEVKGYRLWFMESQIEVELTPEQTEFVMNHKFVSVEYDIPAYVSTHAALFPDENGNSFSHPSQWMWGFGVRTTLSCWLLTEERYNAVLRRLRRLTRAGCNWRRTKIDASDAARHFMSAVIELRKSWLAADASYEECMNRAEEKYNESDKSVKAEREWRYKRNALEKELDKKRENITEGARLMNIPMEWVSKPNALTPAPVVPVKAMTPTVNGVSKATKAISKSEADAHCEMVDALREAGFTNEAELVENGMMPHEIAADICEENGILTDEDGTFSLREVFKD